MSRVHNWLIPDSSFLCHLGAHKRYWIETSFEYVVSSLTNVGTIGFTMITGKTKKSNLGYTYMSMISKTFFLCRCGHLYCLLRKKKCGVKWSNVSWFFQMKKVLRRRSQRRRGKYFSFDCLFVFLLFVFVFVCFLFVFFLEWFDFLTTHYCQMIKPAGSYWIIQGKVSSA